MTPPRFLADSMLGRLARWLRFAGVDCAYERDRQDEAFLRRAETEQRVILTLDRTLAARVTGPCLVPRSTNYREQVREIFDHFALERKDALTRCGECNTPLPPVLPADVFGRVPVHVSQTQTEFFFCPSCGRVYWRGTHVASIERAINELLG